MIVLHLQGPPLAHLHPCPYSSFYLEISLPTCALILAPLTLIQDWQRWAPILNSKQLTAHPCCLPARREFPPNCFSGWEAGSL